MRIPRDFIRLLHVSLIFLSRSLLTRIRFCLETFFGVDLRLLHEQLLREHFRAL
jgi:hypothetical protein